MLRFTEDGEQQIKKELQLTLGIKGKYNLLWKMF